MGVNPKIGGVSPQIIHFYRVFHYKPSILGGTPYFWKHPDPCLLCWICKVILLPELLGVGRWGKCATHFGCQLRGGYWCSGIKDPAWISLIVLDPLEPQSLRKASWERKQIWQRWHAENSDAIMPLKILKFGLIFIISWNFINFTYVDIGKCGANIWDPGSHGIFTPLSLSYPFGCLSWAWTTLLARSWGTRSATRWECAIFVGILEDFCWICPWGFWFWVRRWQFYSGSGFSKAVCNMDNIHSTSYLYTLGCPPAR